MNTLLKLIFATSLLTLNISAFAKDITANTMAGGGLLEDPSITAQKNKSYIARDIKEIQEFIARDNALTQKFVKDKNSKPFIDEREESEKIDNINSELWAKQMVAVTKETVAEMIKAEENFIKNLDIKWNLAKKRGYFDLEKTTPVFEGKRARNEKKLNRLKQKLAKL